MPNINKFLKRVSLDANDATLNEWWLRFMVSLLLSGLIGLSLKLLETYFPEFKTLILFIMAVGVIIGTYMSYCFLKIFKDMLYKGNRVDTQA